MSILRTIRRTALAALMLVAVISMALPASGQQSGHQVLVLELTGVISPPAASYVAQGIHEARQTGASAVVLKLDTPGGLDDSTRQIVKSIANSPVPVILYVSPQGGRAASAGTFIGMASHLLVMAPGTTIGSATPVAIGGEGDAQELPEDLRNKIINEAVSYIRAHAEIHGRNGEWAELAVTEGANLPASEAVAQNVAELMANNLNDLLEQAHGREVVMATGERRALETSGAAVQEFDMGWVTRFLHTIADPNIAFILLSLAILGIFFELANPGLFFPGIFGGLSLLLGLYALGTLNAFWGGILLVFLAMALLIGEAVTPTYGILGLGGLVALIIGGAMLFIDAPPGVALSPWTLWTTAGIAGITVLFFVRAVLATRRKYDPLTGQAALVGETGIAKSHLIPDGYVLVHGERWRAHALDGGVGPGEEVVVERAEGMDLWVRPKKGA